MNGLSVTANGCSFKQYLENIKREGLLDGRDIKNKKTYYSIENRDSITRSYKKTHGKLTLKGWVHKKVRSSELDPHFRANKRRKFLVTVIKDYYIPKTFGARYFSRTEA